MKAVSLCCAAIVSFVASTGGALAKSPFDGTWKGRLTSLKIEGKPDIVSLKDGIYRCDTCIPAFAVKADGAFRHVAGKPYWDDIAVAVVDAHRVSYRYRKDGRVVGTGSDSVSDDGRVVTVQSRNTNNAAGVPVEAVSRRVRVGDPVAGAHLISGSWQAASATELSDAALVMTMRVAGGRLHLTSPMGETLDAVIGGPYAANVGDPGKTLTRVEQAGPRTLRLTSMRAGRVVDVTTYVVAADGTSLAGRYEDPRNGEKGSFEASRM